jgi:hypothetical protein
MTEPKQEQVIIFSKNSGRWLYTISIFLNYQNNFLLENYYNKILLEDPKKYRKVLKECFKRSTQTNSKTF